MIASVMPTRIAAPIIIAAGITITMVMATNISMACIVITDIPVAIVVATCVASTIIVGAWIKWTCSTWDRNTYNFKIVILNWIRKTWIDKNKPIQNEYSKGKDFPHQTPLYELH